MKSNQFMGLLLGSFGIGTVLFPSILIQIAFQRVENPISPLALLLAQYFGSQSFLAGTVMYFSTFTPETFKMLGIAVVPFVVADICIWLHNNEILTPLATGIDFVGNLLYIYLCYRGCNQSKIKK